MMKMKKTLFLLLNLLLVVSIGIAAYIGYVLYQQQQALLQAPAPQTVTREGVLKQIQTLNRLETMAFHIDTVVRSEKQGTWYKLWQDQEKALFMVKGQVVAGIDLSQLNSKDILLSEDGRHMSIRLPAAHLFSVSLSDIQIYDYQRGWLNVEPMNQQLLQQVQNAARIQIKQSACDADILNLANDQAQKHISRLFGLANLQVSVQSATLPNCHTSAILS